MSSMTSPNLSDKKNAAVPLAGGGFVESLKKVEDQLARGGLTASEQRQIFTDAVESFGRRLTDAGKAAGWSTGESKELFGALLCGLTVGAGEKQSSLQRLFSGEAPLDEKLIREGVTLLRCFAESNKIEPFGLRMPATKVVTQVQLGEVRPRDNACGPEALFYQIQSGRGEEKLTDPKACQALYEELCRVVAPGRFGTDPDKLPGAVKQVTGGEFELTEHSGGSSLDAQKIIDRELGANRSCVVKYGSSLLNQHYDCIRSVEEIGGVKVYSTTSGYTIPETRLRELISQLPYANHVWTMSRVEKASLPAVDVDVVRQALGPE